MGYFVKNNIVHSDYGKDFIFICRNEKEAHYLCNHLTQIENEKIEANKHTQEIGLKLAKILAII